MTKVKLKDLRQNFEKYNQLIKAGESFVVYRKAEPLFRIAPLNEGDWEEVIDFTKIQKGGVNIKELLQRL